MTGLIRPLLLMLALLLFGNARGWDGCGCRFLLRTAYGSKTYGLPAEVRGLTGRGVKALHSTLKKGDAGG